MNNQKNCPICGHPLFEGNCYFCFEEQSFEKNLCPAWLADKNKKILRQAQEALKQSKTAILYCKNRGLNYQKWGLGFIPDGAKLVPYGSEKNPESWWNRILFPICDIEGNIIAFGGRTILTEKEIEATEETVAKYKNSFGGKYYSKGKNLYLYHLLPEKSKRPVCLVEGYCDAITAIDHNFLCVATLGTAFTREQALLLSKKAERIRLCFDNDEHGEIAAKKALLTLCRIGVDPNNISRMILKGSKDIDEALRKREHIEFVSVKDVYGDDRKLISALYGRKETF